jgi:uncharacterized protein (TIGR00645 family)
MLRRLAYSILTFAGQVLDLARVFVLQRSDCRVAGLECGRILTLDQQRSAPMTPPATKPPSLGPLAWVIFASRWLQLPLYLGLIIAQGVYVFLFLEELWHLVEILWRAEALDASITRLGIGERNKENVIMIIVLSLIDVVMISNLLIMVIVGGYETFVSRLNLEGHPDQPEWLSHVNANVLKVKLATAIIGISSIHLLKTFISSGTLPDRVVFWQTVIHVVFLVSAVAIAMIDRLLDHGPSKKQQGAANGPADHSSNPGAAPGHGQGHTQPESIR